MGHGIGLETVEPPLLRADQAAELLAGEVLCIEPGLWRQPWGGASLESAARTTPLRPPLFEK